MKTLFLIAFGTIYSITAMSQDVYNFYFNKNQGGLGPATTMQPQAPVVQAPVPVAPAPVAPPAPIAPPAQQVATNVATKDIPIEEQYKYELMLSSFANYSVGALQGIDPFEDGDTVIYTGLALTFNNHFNKYAGYSASLHSVQNMLQKRTKIGGSLGFYVTPLRLNLFGKDTLEWAINFGVQTNYDEVEVAKGDNYDYDRSDVQYFSGATTIDPYFGYKLNINFSERVAMVIDTRGSKRENKEFSTTLVGLKYRY